MTHSTHGELWGAGRYSRGMCVRDPCISVWPPPAGCNFLLSPSVSCGGNGTQASAESV